MKKILLTGLPRIGKTTIIKKVVYSLSRKGYPFRGFYTEEVKEKGKRTGFKIITINGPQEFLAHVSFKGPYRVGKYGVDVEALERILPSIKPASLNEIVVIDEIGKMECFSRKFKNLILTLLSTQNPFLATIALKGDSFIEKIKGMRGIRLIQVTRENRNRLPEELERLLGVSPGNFSLQPF